MEAHAVSRYNRISPQKLRLMADLVRGRRVDEALALLGQMPQKGARIVETSIRSALANAANLEVEDVDRLKVATIFVDGGPVLRRMQPRAMGRAGQIRKPTAHLTVVLDR
ncbi:MAG: 50S ribosomal protein L22 [Nitrospirae bacterium CG18_big_fil_WC_8_21_14_2_50_70_55]|nr:50S ribosomal protein L22 [Deltaproteobacteria bacterium]OIP67002.1 MAG: 50S ribosomal protein L22 [Nitrospirae bacterium CG2_30_70_394]PIQ07267.1 MAG: 50S ribosomal protein L22 [Nitrospirae bacterium CG18_big_fil_WC_8_21_14_2_50_70_55]PIU80132.1 MAG: 50S ribosomal protein L22 [Nitrospirae bacterium CG06_land_8_20_14_3_00_70_43]PIW82693.1 MAG: 50S ribosomal protein L22 [Nitrospirae bacterium CG_4_8_14_3_um_filter_70_85]PIX84028.1 MAG: 50S ribosomal protein L22 [Nitrospirae bacterium CG_4_10